MTQPDRYLSKPLPSPNMPGGIPYIVANEAAERFSFYGMSAILTVFLTHYLMGRGGQPAPMSDHDATICFHNFAAAVYFFPVLGAILSDSLLGKYRTILSFSFIYCLGHLALALDDTRLGLVLGLGLIAFGAGGIKPCVSAHVGDQFGRQNQHLLAKVYGWFYFSINLGAFVSQLLTPVLLRRFGPHVAFAVPGLLMLLATIFFWLGRYKFVHVPPGGLRFVREAFSGVGLRAILRLLVIYLFVAVFYALYQQANSEWVLQAEKLNLHWLGHTWEPSQIQAVNGVLILVFIPLFSYIVYPAAGLVFRVTPLRKIAIGLFLMSLTFIVPAKIEAWLAAGQTPSVGWQILAYALLTAAEILVSITCLEFSYTQAPREMKSVIMALYLLSISAGNLLASLVHWTMPNLTGAGYYWFYAGLMAATATIFSAVATGYQEQSFNQAEAT
ncbi:MAG TPA: POT family MFS transporter [Pirellulales bacterium]|jgi:POT family proton-dependent oligopeptide transporter|nr:POT family MFS transporter [Pirellulales bacterium]